MNIILITGVPGSGKTKISNQLSKDLRINCMSKDDFKVMLYEKYGFSSEGEKQILNEIADNMIYISIINSINNNKDIIVDKWFVDLGKIINSNVNNNYNIICVTLNVSARIAVARYNSRLLNNVRPKSLTVKNQYPIIDGVTEYEKEISECEMIKKIKSTPMINKAKYFLNIDNSTDFNIKYDYILNFIKKYLR